MSESPGHSRYLRARFLTPSERVRYELRGSKWFFFTWPSAWLLGALLGDYWLALAAGVSLPAVPFLSDPGTHVRPSYLSLALTCLILVLLLLWLAARLHHLTRLARTGSTEPLTHRGRSAPFHYLVPPGFFLALSLLAVVAVALASVPGAGGGVAGRVTLGISALGLGRGIYAALTVLLVLWLAVRWGEWVGDSYVITDDRLIKEHARWTVFGRVYDTREIQIRQVRDIDLHQSRVLWRWLHIGTLNVHSLSEVPGPSDPADAHRGRPTATPDPYQNPERGIHDPEGRSIDNYPGVEWWFAIPDPLRAQREIEEANQQAERGRPPGTAA